MGQPSPQWALLNCAASFFYCCIFADNFAGLSTGNKGKDGTFTNFHSSKNWGTSRLSPAFPARRTGGSIAPGALLFKSLKIIPNSLQRVDTARRTVSHAEMSFVSGDGFFSLTVPLVDPRGAVKAIRDQRPGTLNILAALPIGKRVFSPADESAIDLQGFPAPLQHVQRSCVTPDGKRTVRLNVECLQVVV